MTVTRWVIRRRGDGMYLNDAMRFVQELSEECFRGGGIRLQDGEERISVSVTISPVGAPGGARERVARILVHEMDLDADGEERVRPEENGIALAIADRILAALDAAPRPVEALVAAAQRILDEIARGRLGSIGALHNVYCAHIPVEGVAALSAALAAMKAKEAKT